MLQALGAGHNPLGLEEKTDGGEIFRDGFPLDEPVDEDGQNPGRKAE